MKTKYFCSLTLIVALFAAGPACRFDGPLDALQAQPGGRSPLKDKNKDSAVYRLQKTFHEIYELYKDSVVFVSTERTVRTQPALDPFFGMQIPPQTRRQSGLGTGFLVSTDGYICTNHHVVDKMDRIVVKVGDKTYKASVIGSDRLTDIALLKIDGKGFKPVYFGDSDKIMVGDWAIAIGNPFGLDRTFTVGVVSATVRQDEIGNAQIQTDASINPGNSGGPLINLDGEVIAVNRMIYSQSGGNMGIGFAIPINTTKHVLEQLREFKKVKRGFIGVQIAPMSAEHAKELGLEKAEGALVGTVYPGGPAAGAGLQQRDVIQKVDGKPIKDFRDLLREISQKAIEKPVKLTVWRAKKEITLWVTVRERPEQ